MGDRSSSVPDATPGDRIVVGSLQVPAQVLPGLDVALRSLLGDVVDQAQRILRTWDRLSVEDRRGATDELYCRAQEACNALGRLLPDDPEDGS